MRSDFTYTDAGTPRHGIWIIAGQYPFPRTSAVAITGERLDRVRHWEEGLERFGFVGCRVRMDRHDPAAVSVQLADADFGQLKDPGIRLSLLRFFRSSGIRRVLVDLEGR